MDSFSSAHADGGSASSRIASLREQPHVLFAAAAILGTLALLLLLFRCSLASRDTTTRRKNGARASALPSFDVEGSSAPGGGKTLHPSVAQAAATADVAAVREWLSDESCNIDAQLAADGTTALHAAAGAGHATIVRLLVEHGADALVVDASLATPLHLVAQAGHGLCVKALLDAGADPEGRDSAGATPLALAEAARHMGTARMMRLHLERRMNDAANGGGVLRRQK